MNYEAMKVWVDIGQFLWMIAATVWVFWGDKDRETSGRVKQAENKIISHNGKLIRLEEQVKHIPSHDQIAEMRGDVQALKAQMESVDAHVKGVHRQLELINQYLLERKP